jgi:purine-binding chemotaxis protein CheW
MTAAEAERQVVVFSLHGEHYGLPIASVQEIIRYMPPRVTAAARGPVRGLISLRGRLVPVLDLSDRLGAVLEITDRTRILVIEVSTGALGLIVDAVDGVVDVPAHRIEVIPGAGFADALGDEIATIDDRLVMLLDAERALGGVLPAARATDPSGGEGEIEPSVPPAESSVMAKGGRSQRPSGSAAPRRRSAATPQVPGSRRRPRRAKDDEE